MKKKQALLTIALTGLMSGLAIPNAYAGDGAHDHGSDTHSEKDGCKGKASCNGKDGCSGEKKKADKNSCSGKEGCNAKETTKH